jgi:hypothetical protein
MAEMRTTNTLAENLFTSSDAAGYQFALCESCLWSATLLRLKDTAFPCPQCTKGDVSLIPLAIDEQYKIRFGPNTGMELSFSKKSR